MKKRIYFENLNTIRFLCFLSVFFHHSFFTTSDKILNSEQYRILTRDVFGNGNLGVNFFFVLSGFLITFLLIEEKKINDRISILKFWMRRILRIWPIFFFCVFFGFVIFPELKLLFGQVPEETANPLYYVTFLNNFNIIQNDLPDSSILGVLWSIAIEEQFYLIWPILIALTPLKRLWILFVVLIGISIAFRYFNHDYMIFEYHTLSCMSDLVVGAFGAWLIQNSIKFKNHITNLPKIVIIVIHITFICFFFFRDEFNQSFPNLFAFERIIISISIIYIILEQTFSTNSFFKLGRLRLMSKLGEISYGLYALHFIAILIVTKSTSFLGWNTEFWQITIIDTSIALTLTILISMFSYKYFETPFLKLKERFQFITQ